MDQRATDTLAWLDGLEAEILAHPGAAHTERELLRAIITPEPTTGGLFSGAYRASIAGKVPDLTGRASARAYAHEVMFASDFGQHAVSVPAEIGPLLDTSYTEHQSDTDTLGELLIAARLIGHQSAAVTSARVAFDAAWLALPRTGIADYHPVLVGAILYALE